MTNVAGVKVTSGTYCNIQLIRTGRGNHAVGGGLEGWVGGGVIDQQSDDNSHIAGFQHFC